MRLPPSLAALDPARFRAQAVLSFALADLRSFEVGLGAQTLSAARTQEGWPSADMEATAAALWELSGDRRRPVPDPVGQAWGRVAVVREGQGPQAVEFFQQDGAGRVAVDPEGGDPFWVAQEDLDALAASAR